MTKPIELITIDFWNTLYDASNSEARTQDRMQVILRELKRLKVTVAAETLKQGNKATWQHFNEVWEREHKTPDTRYMVQYFMEYIGVRADAQAIDSVAQSFAEGILRYPPALLPDALDVVRRLAERRLLALISDTAFSPGHILKQVMDESGAGQYFQAFSFSDETGFSKPHPRAFAQAVNSFDVAPECSLHIGDLERTDIAGAKDFGMQAILFRGDRNPWVDYPEQTSTRADAVAGSWAEVDRLIESLYP